MCRRYLVYAHAVGVLRNAVGEMLDILKDKGQLSDTAVVMFSDHGEEFGDHAGDGRISSKHRKEAVGHGQSLYEEQLHVPLMVWHPTEQGRNIDTPVSLVDIAPSAANWLGLRFQAADLAGQLLHEQAGTKSESRVLYASHISGGEKQLAARQGAHKSIWYLATDRSAYFDLVKDPAELHSTPTDELVLKFDRYFLEYDQMQREEDAESAKFTDKQLKRLQSIGYLQGVETAEEE